MHEVSLVRTMFNTLDESFSTEELNRLIGIDLKVGELSNVEPILLQNAFQAVTTAEEKHQSVELKIEVIPIEIHCANCQTNTQIKNYKFACKQCGQPNNNVVKGTELLIHKVHFED